MSYADRAAPARTLTDEEQARLLRETGRTSDTYRDHMLFALALGTGLREFELVGLDMCDVLNSRGAPRARIDLRVFKRCTKDPAPQTVFVSDALRHKLSRFVKWKKHRGEPVAGSEPLFVSRKRRRLSTRRARALFAKYRAACDLSPLLTFHSLRHTFCQALYDGSDGNIRLVQAAARHARIQTSTRYAAPSATAIARAVGRLRC